MPSLIRCTQVFLVLLSAFGFYSTWYLVYKNGMVDLMVQIRDHGPHLLPGTKAPLKRTFTGIEQIDYRLTVLTLFFWEIVDGSLPNASLFCFEFGGQAVAAWSLIYIEGRRLSNRWRLVSFAMCWGLAIQFGAFALFMPIHLLIHLLTSPTVSSRKANDFVVDIAHLRSIPVSLTVGYFVPAVVLALPAPSILTYDQKQTWIAAWQVFPIWLEILQQIVSFLARFSNSTQGSSKKPATINAQTIRALRMVYVFVPMVAGITRVTAISLSITSKLFTPLFAPEFRRVLNPSNVFQTASILPSKRMNSVGEGAFQFLQYDEMVGSVALIVWSGVLFVKKYSELRPIQKWAALKAFAQAAVVLAIFGPCGLAVALTWARDEIVFEERYTEKKKT